MAVVDERFTLLGNSQTIFSHTGGVIWSIKLELRRGGEEDGGGEVGRMGRERGGGEEGGRGRARGGGEGEEGRREELMQFIVYL